MANMALIPDLRAYIDNIIREYPTKFVVDDCDVSGLLDRIYKNFYSKFGLTIAESCIDLWDTHQDRVMTHVFLCIAHDYEMKWREKNYELTTLKILANPDSFDAVDFNTIVYMKPVVELRLKSLFRYMNYKEYLKTPYWKAVRSEAHKVHKGECKRCKASDKLQVHHKSYKHSRGGEHLHVKDELELLCSKCHHSEHKVEGIGEKWGNVERHKKVNIG